MFERGTCFPFQTLDDIFDYEGISTVNCTYNVVCFMVFNATFNNISAISWRSILYMEETGGPRENH